MNKVLNLNQVKWKEFKLKDILILDTSKKKIQVPTGNNVSKKYLCDGNIPRITVTTKNNGIDAFYSCNRQTREYTNFISVAFLGNAFYHPYTATTDMKVHTFQLKNKKLNKYIALFLVTALENNTKNIEFGYQLSSTDMPNKKILLPVDENDEPNYLFMEKYIKQKEKIIIENYKKYIKEEISREYKSRSAYAWKDFSITDLFIPDKGNQNNMNALQNGNIPLVSAKKFNNGYKAFVSKNNKKSYPKHIITLNIDGDGGAGIAYYQPSEHLLDSHVIALIPKEKNLSKETLLFIATAITKQRDKYGHGYSIKGDRLNIFRFMLPINEAGQPDYVYMDNYIKSIEQKKILEYLDYIK